MESNMNFGCNDPSLVKELNVKNSCVCVNY